MPDSNEANSTENVSLYQEFIAEREEILKHKWVKSEEAGRDIGFETALVDWVKNCREKWKKDYLSNSRP